MPRIRWTPEEDERLLDLIAAGKSWTLISGILKRSTKSVKLHAKTLRLVGAKKARLPEEWTEGEREMIGPRPAGRPWTRADDDALRALLDSGMKGAEIARKMKRTVGAIRTRMSHFKNCASSPKARG
jgi:Myb-like DNA-binding domain